MKMKMLIGALALTLSGAAFAAEPPAPKKECCCCKKGEMAKWLAAKTKPRALKSPVMKAMTWAT